MSITDIALITHPKSYMHLAPYPKPNLEAFEAPLRLQMAERYLDDFEETRDYQRIKAPRAARENILRIHTPYVYETVSLMSSFGSGNLGESAQASPDLLRNAIVSVGGAIKAAEYSLENEGYHAFSLLRPPGHHATRSNPGGLCFFNNIGIAISKVMETHGIKRVSILDFDDHYGNGTAEIFYDNQNVQYISIHEYDFENYGLGHYEELGYGEAVGTNVNIPLLDGASDKVYLDAMERVVLPSIESFAPEMIAVSAGFDPHYADPVGNMNIDSSTFYEIGRMLNAASSSADCKGSFSVFEGGYNPLATGPSLAAYLLGIQGKGKPTLEDQVERIPVDSLDSANIGLIDQILSTISQFW